jgi:hypothetical protein
MSTKPKRLYLGGPMRGYPEHNFPSFHEAATALRKLGYDVVNPAELDEAEGITAETPDSAVDLREAFRRDTSALLTCDAIALLPGWSYSKGAQAEKALAEAVDMPVYTYLGGMLLS